MNPIDRFYSAFQKGDFQAMASCYHPEAVFEDPAFGKLNKPEVSAMWQMLITRAKGELNISYADVKCDDQEGSCNWVAEYTFGKQKRPVRNTINATFRFEGDQIIRHTDRFNFHKWAGQALGPIGKLMGWLPPFQAYFQKKARASLFRFMQKLS